MAASEGTQFVFAHPELWASPEDHRAAMRDSQIYGTSFARRDPSGLLKRIDPTTVTPEPETGAVIDADEWRI